MRFCLNGMDFGVCMRIRAVELCSSHQFMTRLTPFFIAFMYHLDNYYLRMVWKLSEILTYFFIQNFLTTIKIIDTPIIPNVVLKTIIQPLLFGSCSVAFVVSVVVTGGYYKSIVIYYKWNRFSIFFVFSIILFFSIDTVKNCKTQRFID